jgi:dienelactone hydrolase
MIYRSDPTRTWRTTRKYEQPFTPDQSGRPIRISVWYPAAGPQDKQMRFERYVNPPGPSAFAELNHIIEMRELANSSRVPAGRWSDLLTTPVNAYLEAAPAVGRFPLILYAGSLDSTSTTTVFVMAEFLASHGYVVATVPLLGPTNENPEQGRMPADRERAVQDLEFAWSVIRSQPNVDDTRIGVFGKSLGGIEALIFAMRNANVSAVIGLDATYGFKGNEKLLTDMPDYSQRNMRAAFLDIRRDWDDPTSVLNLSAEHGFHYSDRSFITVKKMNHFDFDANAMIAYTFNLPIGPGELVNPDRTRGTAAQGYQILCHMVLDFFDEKLKSDRDGARRLQVDVARADGGVIKHEDAVTAPPSAVDFAAIISKQGFEAATAIVDRYRRETPDDPAVDQTVFNESGYRLIAEHRYQEAIGIMRLVVYAFPNSANAFDSLADAYLATGQKQAAREALENALKLIAADATMTPTNKAFMSRIEQEKLDQLNKSQ